jgi:hypothetical protein
VSGSSGFSIKSLHVFLFSPVPAVCPAHLICLDSIILIINVRVQVEVLITQYSPITSHEVPKCAFFSNFYYSIPLGSKYSFQHRVLKHSQSMFFP